MPQGALKLQNTKLKEKVKKPKPVQTKKGAPQAAVKKSYKLPRAQINKQLTKIINKNIEQQMIEKALKEKPTGFTILKPEKLRPADSIKRRKKLMQQAESIVEQKMD